MGEKRSFRVLVVDDDRDILELLAYNLEKEGFRVKVLEERGGGKRCERVYA